MKKIELLTCEFCKKECFFLLDIRVAENVAWGISRGICSDCFRKADFDDKFIGHHRETVENKLREAEQDVCNFKEELLKIDEIQTY